MRRRIVANVCGQEEEEDFGEFVVGRVASGETNSLSLSQKLFRFPSIPPHQRMKRGTPLGPSRYDVLAKYLKFADN